MESPVGGFPKEFDAPKELFEVDGEAWKDEVKGLREYFTLFGEHLPKAILKELDDLERRVSEL